MIKSTVIPDQAITAAQEAIITACLCHMTRESVRRMLEAVEEVWPHEITKRDAASTTSSRAERAIMRNGRIKFGFGLPDVKADCPVAEA